MILNNASDIQSGDNPTASVYHGSTLIWQRGTPPTPPPSPYDETKYTLVLLDSGGNPTQTKYEFYNGQDAGDFLKSSDRQSSERYMLWWGDNTTLDTSIYPGSNLIHDWYNLMFQFTPSYDYTGNLIKKIRYRADLTNISRYSLKEDTRGTGYWLTGTESVILPESLGEVGDEFRKCSGLKELEVFQSTYRIYGISFTGCTSLQKITIHKAEGSITGSPWGAPNNPQIIWTG